MRTTVWSCLRAIALLLAPYPTIAQSNWQQIGASAATTLHVVRDSSGVLLATENKGKLYRSTDDGRTWIPIGTNRDVGRTLIATGPGSLYWTSSEGTQRSVDGGITWTPAPGARALAVGPDDAIYAMMTLGMRRSTDGGVTFQPLPQFASITASNILGLWSDGRARLYAATTGGLFVSSDLAQTWTSHVAGLEGRRIFGITAISEQRTLALTDSGLYHSDAQGPWSATSLVRDTVTRVVVDGSGGIVAFLPGHGAYRSVDLGETWTLASRDLKETASAVTAADGSVLAADVAFSMARLRSNGLIEDASSGMTPLSVRSLVVTPRGTIIGGGFGRWIVRSTDNGDSWMRIRTDTMPQKPPFYASLAMPNGDVYLGGYEGGVLLSTDDGLTWSQHWQGVGDVEIFAFVGLPDGRVLVGTERGLMKSDSGRAPWIPTSLKNTEVWSLLRHPDGTIIAGQHDGRISWSSDDGATWTAASTSTLGDIQDMDVAPDGTVYGATWKSGGVIRSTDAGRTWTATTHPNLVVTAIKADRNGLVHAAGEHFFYSSDGGATWRADTVGLGLRLESPLAIDSAGHLLMGPSGVYRRSLVPAGIESAPIEHAGDVSARLVDDGSGAPAIEVELTRGGRLRVELFDALGCSLLVLADARVGAGPSRARIPAGLASGVYHVRVTLDGRGAALVTLPLRR